MTITLTEDALLIFFLIWVRKIPGIWMGIEPTILNPSSGNQVSLTPQPYGDPWFFVFHLSLFAHEPCKLRTKD